jgi:hypothetical protein
MIKKGVLIVNELEKENEMNTKKEKQPTFNNRGYIITIKILIWLGCFVSYFIVNTLFSALTGFMFGYGITIFFLLFGAKKLCDKWEENYIKIKSLSQTR